MKQLHFSRLFVVFASFASLTHAALLDDFESGTTTNLFGGKWFAYADRNDGGNSAIVNGIVDSVDINLFTLPQADAGATGKCIAMQYQYGTVFPHRGIDEWGYVIGLLSTLSSDSGGNRDLTGATAITFWAKASVTPLYVRFMVTTTDITDFAYHRKMVLVDTVWTKYTVSFSSLKQPSWTSVTKTFQPGHASRLLWEISYDDYYSAGGTSHFNPMTGTLLVDSVDVVDYFAAATEIVKDYPATTTNLLPTFKWHTVSQAASYTIQIASTTVSTTAPNFTSPTLQTILADTVFTPSAALTPGYVYFRVKSDISRWSEVGSFLIVDARIPSLIAIPSPTYERKPVFAWHVPEGAVTSYTLQVATNSSFTSPVISAPTVDTFYASATELPLGAIYWRVNADNSAYSSVSSFVVEDGKIPAPEPVESPTYNRKPTLSWKKPVAAVSSYTLQIATTSTFVASSMVLDAPVTDTFYSCVVNLPIATIYWRVKGDNSGWSAISSFQLVDNRIPVPLPYDGSSTNRRPTVRWQKPPVTVSGYTIQIASSTTFTSTSILVEASVTDTFFACTTLLPIGVSYWRVKAEDSQYSIFNSLTIQDARIPALVAYTPKITLNTKPTLQWYKVPGAASYNFEIANNAAFTSPVVSIPLVDTFYSVLVPLSLGNYYWRVKSDLVATWSGVDNFTIVSDSIPFISRFNGNSIDERKPVFAWNKVSGASSYRFMLANNASFTDAISMPLADTTYTPSINLELGKWYWKVSSDRNIALFCPVDSFVIGPATVAAFVAPRLQKQGVVEFYDISGRSLGTSVVGLRNGSNPGQQNFYGLNGKKFPSGIYLMRIITPDGVTVRRVARQR